MNAARKMMLLLGVTTLFLCVPLTAAAEDGVFETPLSINFAIPAGTASSSVRGVFQIREQLDGASTPVYLASRRGSSERDTNFVLSDGRSHLRSFCLLRC